MKTEQTEGPLFSINEYDYEGDITEGGIFLHFKDTKILVARDMEGFMSLIEHLKRTAKEISENYDI